MGFLAKLIGTENVVNRVSGLASEYIVDKDKLAEFETRIQVAALSHKSMLVSLFVAGPKPFLMWVSGRGFAIHYILNPLMSWVIFLFGIEAILCLKTN